MKNAYLHIAKRDIKTAEILFAVERFPEALFYLQQSAEKAMKYLALRAELIPENKITSYIGHDIKKFFINVAKDFVYKFRMEEFSKYKEAEMHKSINKLTKIIESQDDDFIEFLNFIDSKKVAKAIEGCKLKKTIENRNKLVDFMKNKSDSFESILAFIRLFLIALMTFDHYENSRYPFKYDGKYQIPENRYNNENKIINNLNHVIDNLKQTIASIEKGFDDGTFVRISEKNG
jgi:HEPN domain-containing protein